MLSMTSSAADAVNEICEERGLPIDVGVRVYNAARNNGQGEVQMAFVAEPMAGDAVTEAEGRRLFLAPDVAEPLADAVIDALETPQGKQLILRQPA